jgi:hypothetical protein
MKIDVRTDTLADLLDIVAVLIIKILVWGSHGSGAKIRSEIEAILVQPRIRQCITGSLSLLMLTAS